MSVQKYNAGAYFLSSRGSLVDQRKTPSFMEILCGAKEVKAKQNRNTVNTRGNQVKHFKSEERGRKRNLLTGCHWFAQYIIFLKLVM